MLMASNFLSIVSEISTKTFGEKADPNSLKDHSVDDGVSKVYILRTEHFCMGRLAVSVARKQMAWSMFKSPL